MDHSAMSPMSRASMSSMILHFGTNETVLFDFWKFSSTWGLILSCLILVVFSIVKEAARVSRAANCGSRLVDGLLHIVVLTLSYFLMVIFMNLNVWMCATIIVAEVLSHAVSAYCNTLLNVNFFEK